MMDERTEGAFLRALENIQETLDSINKKLAYLEGVSPNGKPLEDERKAELGGAQ